MCWALSRWMLYLEAVYLSYIEHFAFWTTVCPLWTSMTILVLYYRFLNYPLNIPQYCWNFCIKVHAKNDINLTRIKQILFYSFHALLMHSFVCVCGCVYIHIYIYIYIYLYSFIYEYKYIFIVIFIYKCLQGLSKIFLLFFLGKMLHHSGFIPRDKFPSFEANDGSVLPHTWIGLLKMIYCELQELFGLLLYWAVDKIAGNESSYVRLH
jgi:hypothetical protein